MAAYAPSNILVRKQEEKMPVTKVCGHVLLRGCVVPMSLASPRSQLTVSVLFPNMCVICCLWEGFSHLSI